jgi:hypothetical protein
MNNGTVVITSREDRIIEGCIGGVKKIEPTTDFLVWKFKNEDYAIRAAKVFMNSNFEYVIRV